MMDDEATGLRRRVIGNPDEDGPIVGSTGVEQRRPVAAPAADGPPAAARSTSTRSSAASWLTWLLGGEPATPESMAIDLHNRLKREYGDLCPDFVHLSFREATTIAKNEGKFLVIYLHSEVHQDTHAFCKNSLCTDEVVAFTLAHDNILFWAGSVLQAEGYSVALSLGAASFPFLSMVISTPRGLNIIEKVHGNLPKDQLVARLGAAIARNQQHLVAVRAQEQFRTEAQVLREQQDLEYQESLEADRRKAEEEMLRQEREEAEARQLSMRLQEEAEAARREAAEREAAVAAKRQRLDGGPTVKGKDTAFIRFQLHNGAKVERLFWAQDTFETIRAFVDVTLFDRDIPIVRYEVATNFPRKSWGPDDDQTITLHAAGLTPQSLLYVQDLDS
ncbi:Aste57867_11670 [Aphanomyces stellatus]|uniref:Aste57867_11670 protein n=1 Tax=Aphanomyces stellatus TaxID=120398 RepID=A0A485KVI9_9STRA|nr:hypothetical protein As57867_011627 [Aphanomyces stellatus]VFT88528.1 Aste57867_11670 [Aphanomyces stellatus]